jgi:hypothetical protein
LFRELRSIAVVQVLSSLGRCAAAILLLTIPATSRAAAAELPPGFTRFTFAETRQVFLAGEFNGWNGTATPLRQDGTGRSFVDLPLQPGRYEYKFVVDGEWLHDPANPETVDSGWGGRNSVMTVPEAVAEHSSIPLQRYIPPVKQLRWSCIEYAAVPIPGTDMQMRFTLRPNGFRDGRHHARLIAQHLGISVLWTAAPDVEPPPALERPQDFVVRLHRPGAAPIAARPPGHDTWGGGGNLGGVTYQRHYAFPWSPGSYDEGWIEFRMREHVYWLEVPYGFLGYAAEPASPADAQRGKPVLPQAMRQLPADARLVPWLHVEYEWGEIQNSWHLSVKLVNHGYPAAELELYNESGGWSFDAPRTAVAIKRTRRHDLSGGVIAHYRADSMRRADVFGIGWDSTAGREHGLVTINVEDATFAFPVPSSLYKRGHGAAEPHHPQRISRGHDLLEQVVKRAY